MKPLSLLFVITFFSILPSFLVCQSTETFDGPFPPSNWTNNGCFKSTTTFCEGTGACYFNNAGDDIITPLLANPLTLSFQYRRGSTSIDGGIDIEYSSAITGPWTLLGSFNDFDETCKTGNLNSLPSNIYIRFIDTRTTGSARRYIDEVTVQDMSLPIEISSFRAAKTDNVITLSWTTLSETSNSHFEIEHKSEESSFEKIGHIDGNGTTISQHDYSFQHKPSYGVNYYRLKQVDFDGTYSYSSTVSIEFEISSFVLVYPTLVNNYLNLQMQGNQNQYSLSIFDLFGHEYLYTTIKPFEDTKRIEVNKLPAGHYFLKVTDSIHSSVFRFIKL